MGIVHGNWLTGTHSGRACKHEDVYTRVNKKTGACYSAKLCNPNPYRNETQKKTTSAFGLVSAAVAAWIAAEKAKNPQSDEFIKLMNAFNRQTRYATLRGMIMAKGMFKLENGAVVVDSTANNSIASIAPSIQLPEGGSANSPAAPAPAEKFTLTLSASPSVGGSVTGAGQYAKGAQATIKATAKSGYTFTRWSDGDTNAERTITLTADTTLQAIFTANSGSGETQPGGGSEVGQD